MINILYLVLLAMLALTDPASADPSSLTIETKELSVAMTALTERRADPGDDLAGATGSAVIHQFGGLHKAQAQEVYRACQFQEQAWREKRRVRELEELRAKSGGLHLAGGLSGLPAGGGS